jgi:hypothetical protein
VSPVSEVERLKDTLQSTVNSSAWSSDSLYGVIILLLIGWILIKFAKNVTRSIGSIIGLIILLEVGHMLAFNSSVGTDYPILQEIFKYDVLTALAKLCEGTKISEFLLSARVWLSQVIDKVAGYLSTAVNMGIDFFKGVHT